MTRIRWNGTAFMEYFHNGQYYLVDPFISRPNKIDSLFKPLIIDKQACDRYLDSLQGKVQAIVMGHAHMDHSMDVPYLVEKTGAQVYGSQSMKNLLGAFGLGDKIHVVKQGDKLELGKDVILESYESMHGRVLLGKVPFPGEIESSPKLPMKASGYKHGTVYIHILQIGGRKYANVGSAELVEKNLEGARCDVLFPCASGRQFTDKFVDRIVKALDPSVVVPIHFDDFSTPLKVPVKYIPGINIGGMVREIHAAKPGALVIVPNIRAEMEL